MSSGSVSAAGSRSESLSMLEILIRAIVDSYCERTKSPSRKGAKLKRALVIVNVGLLPRDCTVAVPPDAEAALEEVANEKGAHVGSG